eukprot:9411937-Pyramimonas_sp.AAC.1
MHTRRMSGSETEKTHGPRTEPQPAPRPAGAQSGSTTAAARTTATGSGATPRTAAGTGKKEKGRDFADPEQWAGWTEYKLWRRKIVRWRQSADVSETKHADRVLAHRPPAESGGYPRRRLHVVGGRLE